jgi:Voltage gated chloride channel
LTSTTASPDLSAAATGDERRVGLLVLCLLALGVGIMTGIGAVILRSLIGLIHNLMFNGVFRIAYDANILEGPSRWGNWVFLSPILGGLVVVYLVDRFAPKAKGHGVPEVMDAIFYKRGNIRGMVAVIKSLASAILIGSGAAVGRAGPIIQIGSALGSAFSQWIHLSPGQKITLIAAGAGAGIAATFNTPLGGVLFAVEILLPEVSNRTFLPVVISTSAADRPESRLRRPRDPVSAGALLRRRGGARVCCAWRLMRRRGLGLHPPARLHGGRPPENSRRRLCAEHHRHGRDRPDDGRAAEQVRPHLCRWRRLRRHPVGPRSEYDGGGTSRASIRAQAVRDHDQPRLRHLGRHLLALALSRRDAWRIVRVVRHHDPAERRHDHALGGDRRHGGDGRRGNRRRHDGDHHGLRDDPRLRDHRASDRCRRRRFRSQAGAHLRDGASRTAAKLGRSAPSRRDFACGFARGGRGV